MLAYVLLIDEHIRADGSCQHMYLALEPDPCDGPVTDPMLQVVIRDDRGQRIAGRIAVTVLAGLMHRYGRPLEQRVPVRVDGIELGRGRSISGLRFRAAVDASSRDYLVWRGPEAEVLAAIGRQIAAALRFLLERAPSNHSTG